MLKVRQIRATRFRDRPISQMSSTKHEIAVRDHSFSTHVKFPEN